MTIEQEMISTGKNRNLVIAISIASVLTIASCKTYYIPVNKFTQQLSGFKDADLRKVTVQGPVGDRVTYETYPINVVQAEDKNGTPKEIIVSPAIEVRITDTNNKRTVFYFDLIRFDGKNIIGGQSRFIPSMRESISAASIKKVEIQSGGKNFRYVQ